MAKQGLHFSGHVTPLFPNMLAQAVVDEGEGSEQPNKPQPTPSPTQPSTGDQPPVTESSYRPDTTQDPRVNLEGTGGSQGDHVQIPHDSPLSGGHTSDRAVSLKILSRTMEVRPYTPTIVTTPAVPAIEDSLAVPEQTIVETVTNMTPENRAHFESKKEAVHLILTGIGDKIYSTFLQQLQPEWSRFVTIVKQQHKLDRVSYHKLFDILKQYQKEVNELRAERMAKNANPLALVAIAHTFQDPYYQTSKPYKSYAPTSKASLPTKSHVTTRYKGKEIAKPITPPSELASEEDSDLEQAQKDKDMQKNLALIAKYFKKHSIKPNHNNLQNFLKTPKQKCGYHSKNTDRTSKHTDEEIDEQELEAHYSYMAKIQEVPNADSDTDAKPLEQVQYDTDDNVFANDIQHFKQSESINNTCAVEMGDSNVIPDSPDMCDNDIQDEQMSRM
ncbi:hypothetical protein Tco_0025171 [Tanacetum coccineum]